MVPQQPGCLGIPIGGGAKPRFSADENPASIDRDSNPDGDGSISGNDDSSEGGNDNNFDLKEKVENVITFEIGRIRITCNSHFVLVVSASSLIVHLLGEALAHGSISFMVAAEIAHLLGWVWLETQLIIEFV